MGLRKYQLIVFLVTIRYLIGPMILLYCVVFNRLSINENRFYQDFVVSFYKYNFLTQNFIASVSISYFVLSFC
jgi:hypothetical protein